MLLFAAFIHKAITYIAGYNLNSCETSCFFCLTDSYFAKLRRVDKNMTEITVCNVTNCNIVTSFNTLGKCSRTVDFYVVGMTSYC